MNQAKVIDTIRQHLTSRKFALILLVVVLSTLALVVPPFFHKVILDQGSYVSLITICLTTYFAANVTAKHNAFNSSGENTNETPK